MKVIPDAAAMMAQTQQRAMTVFMVAYVLS